MSKRSPSPPFLTINPFSQLSDSIWTDTATSSDDARSSLDGCLDRSHPRLISAPPRPCDGVIRLARVRVGDDWEIRGGTDLLNKPRDKTRSRAVDAHRSDTRRPITQGGYVLNRRTIPQVTIITTTKAKPSPTSPVRLSNIEKNLCFHSVWARLARHDVWITVSQGRPAVLMKSFEIAPVCFVPAFVL